MSRTTSVSGSPADEQVSSRHHQRTPSGQLKKTKTSGTKTLRPLTTRRESSKTHPKPKPKSTPETDNGDDDDDDLAPTFLQYCATCEQQILTPLSSGLYCSQACKSKDAAETTGYPLFHNDYRIPSSSRRSHPSLEFLGHNVVPQRSPTQPSALFPRHQSTPSRGNTLASTAPSSYKPGASMKRDSSSSSLSSLSTSPSSHSGHQSHSEASIYLQQFHLFGYSESTCRSSTTNDVPSLSHTPSSHKTSSESLSPSPATRPAMRPHTSFSNKGIDLVTPITAQEQAEVDSTGTCSVASDDTIRPSATSKTIPIHSLSQQHLSYEKQAMSKTHGGGSLKQLLEARK